MNGNDVVGVSDVVPVPSDVSAVDTTDDIIALAERRIERIEKIKSLALRATNHYDWVDQDGKPYLQGSGAEKVARLFGVKIRDVKSEKVESEDEKRKFYYYLVRGVMELPGGVDSIEAIGTCSSKDQFFAMRTDKDSGEKYLLPLSEVDETNIMKSAYTNFLVNGITRLLGIRNLTWEQVELAGVNVEKVAKVSYGKGFKRASLTAKQKELRDKIGEMLMAMAGQNKKVAGDFLRNYTTFTDNNGKVVQGKKSLEDLGGRQIEAIYGKIKRDYEEWLKQEQPSSQEDNSQQETKGAEDDRPNLFGRRE